MAVIYWAEWATLSTRWWCELPLPAISYRLVYRAVTITTGSFIRRQYQFSRMRRMKLRRDWHMVTLTLDL
jgi:hypothetical protein